MEDGAFDKVQELLRTGDFADARALLEDDLSRNRGDVQAWVLLGGVCGQLGDLDAVVFSSREALRIDAAQVDAWYNLAQAHMHRGEHPQAAEAYRQLLRHAPEHLAARMNLGYILEQSGRYAEAVDVLEPARAGVRPHPDILNNLGNAYAGLGRDDEALSCYRAAVKAQPQHARAWCNMGGTLKRTGEHRGALQALDRALALRPDYVEALIGRGLVLQGMGLALEAQEFFDRAHALAPASLRAAGAALFNLNYHCPDPARVFEVHRAFVRNADGESARLPPRADARPLRVGYVSADFRAHSVASFIEPVLAAHDRQRVEVWCYARVARPDETTRRLRGLADHWRDLNGFDAAAAARQIRADGIDVLVDLAGHTETRILEIFTRRVAPVQLSWIGYPNTTGLVNMDFRITDAVADPPGEAERFCSERLLRLDTGFLCYAPPVAAPEVAPLPASGKACITFGSFNNQAKFTPEIIRDWAYILRAVPGARLLIKNRSLADSWLRQRLLDQFCRQGVPPGRVETLAHLPRRAHLSLYNQVDIALDTWPYHGTTTTCEALWMGVPVVTRSGAVHASRVGPSLLRRLGLDGWVAQDARQYRQIAIDRAGDLSALARLRSSLRTRMQASSLCDAAGFVPGLEDAYEEAVRQMAQKESKA